jgi:hypothetical protein
MKDIPAFPRTQWPNETGMTLRDYFAAKAMQAILMARYPVTKDPDAEHKIAVAAYQGADAMMKARTE